MEIRFMAKNVEVPAGLKEYMIKKFSRMEKFFPQIIGQIMIKTVRDTCIVEVTANVKGVIMRGEERDLDLRKAFDLGLKNLERRIRRHKEFLVDRAHLKSRDFTFEEGPSADDAARMGIVKEKRFDLAPMTPEEAVMQMDLLEHSFYMFLNAESGKINVVYKREAGGYGLLMPNE